MVLMHAPTCWLLLVPAQAKFLVWRCGGVLHVTPAAPVKRGHWVTHQQGLA